MNPLSMQGEIPLIIDVTNADIMATLLTLKSETEEHINATMRVAFSRATEAHLIAKDIGVYISRTTKSTDSDLTVPLRI